MFCTEIIYLHKWFVMRHKQGHIRRVWWCGHLAHGHYPTTLLRTANKGQRVKHFSVSLLHFFPLCEQQSCWVKKQNKTLAGSSVESVKNNVKYGQDKSWLGCFFSGKITSIHLHSVVAAKWWLRGCYTEEYVVTAYEFPSLSQCMCACPLISKCRHSSVSLTSIWCLWA